MVAASAGELGDHRRVDRRAASGDAADGGPELADVRDAVFEQVAEPLGTVRQQV
jgi:hypothetical protein